MAIGQARGLFLRNAKSRDRRKLQRDHKMPADTGATRFVSLATLFMLVGLVSLLYLNS
jgi:hypothetical protein